ncbi:aminopeptidase P N-terminal domain-containing protein [Aromatoleum bremense]|uniref:Xaa-Pro aminopeptidase n=1 Tax=Aromatoleum bremense TaxID=76115 RepID=A0ABX1NR57_9RHOO|nr:aminopeptidase P N-terminal domain-containing protein [Aromatoleum bremense]NMG14378.1 M24 family metallopeptidase [Aromatoleum bremense]QTQ31028.1 Putative aminopeptidase [Aromatoleum bremense]
MNSLPERPVPDIAPFHARRERLLARMNALGGGIAVLPTAPECPRNRDTHYPFRHDSYFHYLTGFGEPEAVVVLVAGDPPRSILFCREKNEEREIWDGYRFGPDAARERFGFDEAWTIGDLDQRLPDLLANQPKMWCALGYEADWDARVMRALNAVRANARAGAVPPHAIHDVRTELDEMRLVKDESELAIMRRAAAISGDAHRRAMAATRPGRHEYEIEAELLHSFRRAGSQAPAYPSIVASGPNACVLHYVENDRVMADGELLLIDAGCELDGYASDITRTFPVNGRFTGAQRDVYELVLAAQRAAKDTIRPGVLWNDPHDAAVRVIAQGLLDLDLLSGTLDAVIEQDLYRRFYMHRTGHWLGRDVHDAGEYKRAGEWRPLEPGMVLTVEPGCYIRAAADVPEAFWNIGVRIEDDAVVTATGCEFITDAAPRSIADIEAVMREGAGATA